MSILAQARSMVILPNWVDWLRRELAPFPGRAPMTIRIVVTVAIVTATSMALQVPQLAFSAFFVFLVTRENRVLTTMTGMIMMFGATIATALNLMLYSFTFDYPELRVPVMAGFIFTAMFFSRTFVIGPLGFVVGFLGSIMQTTGEAAPNPELLVRNLLFLWVAVVYPIGLTLLVNQVLLPADPWLALLRSFNLRLDAAADVLRRILREGTTGGHTNRPLLDLAVRGSINMLGLLNFSEMKDPQLKPGHPLLVETVAAASHVASSAAALDFRQRVALSAEDMQCARELLSDLEQLKTAVTETDRVLPPRTVIPPPAVLPQLRELQFAVESFRDSLVRGGSDYSSTNAAPKRKPLFSPDAFTNPLHLQFALKVTLAAMSCYLIYTGLHWPGISTSLITCCIVALGNTGATIYKIWLRIIGCLAGGLFGFLMISLVVPHLESITSLLGLIIFASALAGWVATGSERISYAGLQFAFVFYLSIFQGFEPQTNLTVIRDRVVGIMLGTIVSAIVFRFVWPEHAADQLRPTLARILQTVAQLARLPKPGLDLAKDAPTIIAAHAAMARNLDAALVLSEQVKVENLIFHNPKGFSPALLEHLTMHVQVLCLMTTALLRRTKLEEWQHLDKTAQQNEATLRSDAADYLERLAGAVESAQPLMPAELETACANWNLAVAQVAGNDRPRLVRRFINQVRELT